ncbi:MAG: hypothetical protein BGO64_14345 [Aeromonas sp. 62-46]|nr:MAG: hypothetical protein BGO64_14345 [Aeromonas sp. 62-46]
MRQVSELEPETGWAFDARYWAIGQHSVGIQNGSNAIRLESQYELGTRVRGLMYMVSNERGMEVTRE